jgi:hypothetical protein
MIIGAISANSEITQVISAPEGSELSGVNLAIEPGTLGVDMNVGLEATESLISARSASQMGISFEGEAGAAVNVSNDASLDVIPESSPPMQLQIPLSSFSLNLAEGKKSLVIFFRRKNGSSSCNERIYPPSVFENSDDKVAMKVRRFGAYQPLFVPKSDLLKKLKETPSSDGSYVITRENCKVVTKAENKKLPKLNMSELSIERNEQFFKFSSIVSGEKVSSCFFYARDLISGKVYEFEEKKPELIIPLSAFEEELEGRASFSCTMLSGRTAETGFKSFSSYDYRINLASIYGMPIRFSSNFDSNQLKSCFIKGWSSDTNGKKESYKESFEALKDPSTALNSGSQYDYDKYVEGRLECLDADKNSKRSNLVSFYLKFSNDSPTVHSFKFINEASEGLINKEEKDSTKPLAEIKYSGANASDIRYTELLPYSQSFTCSEDLSYTEVSIPSASQIIEDGFYSLCAKVPNSNGKVTYAKLEAPISRDTTPPEVIYVNMNPGEENSTSTSTTLRLIAIGATEALISEFGDCSESSWESYHASKTWDIRTENPYGKIHFKLRDSIGNESQCISASTPFGFITEGDQHACSLKSNGAVYCWGDAGYGQLGNGGNTDQTMPVAISEAPAFIQIAAGSDHTCGLKANGSAYCWGRNNTGQLGNGSTNDQFVPVDVSGNHTFTQIVVGSYHTCGLQSDGAAYCWGQANYGQLGNGNTTNQLTPTVVSGSHSFKQITAGTYHTCGLEDGGTSYCWGFNGREQLGNGNSTNQSNPVAVSQSVLFKQISAGPNHSCGIKDDSSTFCWGLLPGNHHYQNPTQLENTHCTDLADGEIISRIRYASSTERTCTPEVQTSTCTSGSMTPYTGTYTITSCTTESRKRYSSSSTTCPTACSAQTQTRKCTEGTCGPWSGTYAYASCTQNETFQSSARRINQQSSHEYCCTQGYFSCWQYCTGYSTTCVNSGTKTRYCTVNSNTTPGSWTSWSPADEC